MSILEKNLETKKEIRKRICFLRDMLSNQEIHEKSCKITKRLTEHPCYKQASQILVYRNFGSEVGTREVILAAWRDGKKTYSPRISGKKMEFLQVGEWTDYESGFHGIQEPKVTCPSFVEEPEGQVLIVMPGTVFDKAKHRIGYGGGYYDRYLKKHPSYKTAAICFELQMMEHIPYEKHDVSPDVIVTEERTYE